MPSRSEMRADDSVHLDEALRVPRGLEAPHASLPLTRWLMGVLGPVVQVPVLPVCHARHHDSFGGSVAAQFVCNDDAWMPTASDPQQLAEKPHGRKTVALWLHQNIDDDTVLIDSAPKIMPDAINVEEDLIQMPFVSGPRPAFPQPDREQMTEFVAPAPDRFVADQHAA